MNSMPKVSSERWMASRLRTLEAGTPLPASSLFMVANPSPALWANSAADILIKALAARI